MIYIRSIKAYHRFGACNIKIIDEEHRHDYEIYLNKKFNVRFNAHMSHTNRVCIKGLACTEFKPIFHDGELKLYLKNNNICHGENSGYYSYSEFKQHWFKRVRKIVDILPQNIVQKAYIINYGL